MERLLSRVWAWLVQRRTAHTLSSLRSRVFRASTVTRSAPPLRYGVFIAALWALLWLSPAAAVEIDYQFDSQGKLQRAAYSDGTVVTYHYDANGNRTGVTTSGGPDAKPPTIPGAVTATAVSSTRIDVTWTASNDGGSAGLAGYKLERCGGATCTDFDQIATIVDTSVQNNNLFASTMYRYRLRAYDLAGNHSLYSAVVSATTLADTTPPSAPGTLTATAQSSVRIDLSWAAASDAGGSGLAGYRIERCAGASCSNFSQVQQQVGTVYQDDDLAANTTYRYRVRAYDNAGNTSATYTSVASATTIQDTVAPPTPSGLIATANSPTRVDLSWNAVVDAGGSALAGYKVERCSGASCTSYAQIVAQNASSYADTAVTPGTTYRYRVRAYDNASNHSVTYSNVVTVSTPADTTVPTLPATLTATAVSSAQVNLTWAGSTDSGNNLAGYAIERCQGASCTTFAALTNVPVSNPAGRAYSDTNVSPSTTYRYRARAYDNVGNHSGYSPIASASTLADTTAPSAPTVSVTAASSTQLNVSWSAVTDSGGAGLAGYKLERCQNSGCTSFAQIVTLGASTTTYSDTDRLASTTYVYRVRAYDNANPTNHSAYSASVARATLADQTAPTVPANLRAAAASGTQIDLSWSASTDAGGAGLAGYAIERCAGQNCTSFTQIVTTTATAYSNTGVDDAVTYNYRVRAYDQAATPNRSAYSNVTSATTPDATPPVVPPSITFTGVSSTGATVSWAAATDNVAVTGYRYRINFGSWVVLNNVTSVPLSGLTCATTYTVDVQARDAAGQWSPSRRGSFTTLDGCAPGAPGTVTISNITINSATVAWGAATDNVGVTGYQYRHTGGVWTQVTGSVLTANLTDLNVGTTYTVEVQARDAAGNWGAMRAQSFTTHSPPAPPTGSCNGKLCVSYVANCAWRASWNASAGATHYIFRSWSSEPGSEWTVEGTSTTYGCPINNPDPYRPKWVKACNEWGCSVRSDFP